MTVSQRKGRPVRQVPDDKASNRNKRGILCRISNGGTPQNHHRPELV
jgi:hypothetical protein